MAVKITRWEPDTCYCVLEYSWDDALPESERTHSVSRIVRTCPVHTGEPTAEGHYNTVLSENQHKNSALAFIRAKAPAARVDWRFDDNRNLHVQLNGLDQAAAESIQQAVAARFPARTTRITSSPAADSDNGELGHRKPRGELASLQIQGGSVKCVRAKIPNSKEQIEEWILRSAIRAADQRGISLYDLAAEPVKNDENDLDFTLPTTDGTAYLDLMEVVLFKGRTYAEAPTAYSIGEMATQTLAGVTKKSKMYGKPHNPVHLLLYSTDWRFVLVREVLDLVGLWLNRLNPVFATVKYVCPDSDGGAILEHVFPRSSGEFTSFDEQRAMNSLFVFGDIRIAKAEADGTVRIPMQNPLRENS